MCGIWASLGSIQPPEVIDSVAHRGPDGRGMRTFSTAAGVLTLGSRRLAILDLSTAALQPFETEDGRYVIVYNGEIYNFVELRRELEASGRRFVTTSDTEVLLQSYAEWGTAAFDRLNGMFAFAIFDTQTSTLICVRDRFGVKPLYWMKTTDGLAFASEAKQFFKMSGATARIDRRAARDFLVYGITDHDGFTFFDGVSQVEPGTFVTIAIRPNGETTVTNSRWYGRPSPKDGGYRMDDEADRFRTLFDDAVKVRMRSDVPVGSLLSGGVDSSSIVATAAAVSAAPVLTFSAVYPGQPQDESRYISLVNASVGARETVVEPSPGDLFRDLDRLAYAQDFPFAMTSVFAQSEVYRHVHERDVKVVLDGQGADEIFCSYPTGYAPFLANFAKRGDAAGLIRELRALHDIGQVGYVATLLRTLQALLPPAVQSLARRLRGVDPPPWLHPNLAADAHLPYELSDDLSGLTLQQVFRSNLPMLLRYQDRTSMSWSVEARQPFLDYRIVGMMIEFGEFGKIADGWTKSLLRRAMAGRVPAEILSRRDKVPFGGPTLTYASLNSKRDAGAYVARALSRFPSLFDGAAVRDRLRGADDAPVDGTMFRIVSLGAWGDAFDVSDAA